MVTNKIVLEDLGHNGENFGETWVTLGEPEWVTMGKCVRTQTYPEEPLYLVSSLGNTLGVKGNHGNLMENLMTLMKLDDQGKMGD